MGELARMAAFHSGGVLFADGTGGWRVMDYLAEKTPVLLKADRSALPLVKEYRELNSAAPVYKVRVGYDPCWGVHSTSDISPVLLGAQQEQALQDAIDAAREAAENAAAEAEIALDRLDRMAEDGWLSRDEKALLVQRFATATAERPGLLNQGLSFGLAIQRDGYVATYDALKSYLEALTPAYTDGSADTQIDRIEFDGKWTAYFAARQALLNAAADKAASTSTWDGVSGPNKPQDNATVGAPSGTPVGNSTADEVVGRIQAAHDAIEDIDGLTQGILTSVSGLANRVLGAEGEVETVKQTQQTQGASITQLQTTASTQAGELASIQTGITAGNPNLLKNGSFEEGFDRWRVVSQPGGTMGVVTANVWGSYMSFYNNGAPLPAGLYYFDSDLIPLGGTATLTIAGEIDFSGAGPSSYARLEVLWFDANRGFIEQSYGNTIYGARWFGNLNENRKALASTFPCPAAARFAQVRPVVSAQGNDVLHVGWRRIKLEFGSVATPYTLEASIASFNERITAVKDASSALTTRTSSLEGAVDSASGRITNAESAAASAGQAAAQVQQNLNAAAGDINGRLTTTSQVAAIALDRTSGARWSKEAVAGNGRAQLTVYAFDNNGNLQAGVDIIGNVTISGDLTVDGTIRTPKLASNAAQSVQWNRTSSQQLLPFGQASRIVQQTFEKFVWESSIDLYASIRMRSGDDIQGSFRIVNLNNGMIEDIFPIWQTGAGSLFQVPIALNWIASGWAPGIYTLAIDYLSAENDAQTFSEAGSIIKVHEIKR